jgi:hypothetical protein
LQGVIQLAACCKTSPPTHSLWLSVPPTGWGGGWEFGETINGNTGMGEDITENAATTSRSRSSPDPVPQPQLLPQPVPAPPPPMQPPSHHQQSHHQPEQPVYPIHDPANQVNFAQVDSKTEDCDQTSNYTGTSYDPSQLSDSDEEEDVVDDTTIKLGNGYAQCRAAREAAMAADVTNISCNSNALSTEKKKGFRVGAMDKNLGNEILDCFKGARIEQNGNLVNQFLSSSFDPSTLTCITCHSEHSTGGGGGVMALSVLSSLIRIL